jgi:uncharacterized protein (TIGR02266 family)
MRREYPRYPIRLAVRYPSARSLLGDYTRSISRGGVAIESERDLEIGTQFIFELSSPDLAEVVEVHGKVVWTRAAAQPGRTMLGIQYNFTDGPQRERLEKVIETILAEHRYERQRQHPRVPVSLDVQGAGRVWLMRDLSLGGAMMQATDAAGIDVAAGQRLTLELRVAEFDAVVDAEVVWVAQPYMANQDTIHGRFGVRFMDLEGPLGELLEQIMRTALRPERVSMVLRPMPKRGLD